MGIDTTHIHMSDLPTSTFTVLTDRDDNQVGGFYPGAMADSSSLSLHPWERDALVVVSAYDPATMKRLVHEAEERSMKIVYDIGQQVSNVATEDLQEGIRAAEILCVNDYEMEVLSSRTSMSANDIKQDIPIVITTLGKEGSVIEGKDVTEPVHIPAIKDIDIVDPTGAGDAYRAGFLYGYKRGWELKKCSQLASTVASFAIEKVGTQEHDCTMDQIRERYYKQYKENL
jgi:adenosine kinase